MSSKGREERRPPQPTLGCADCRAGVYAAGQPRFVIASSPVDLLYRCGSCRTWWIGDGRSLHPVSDDEALRQFPEELT